MDKSGCFCKDGWIDVGTKECAKCHNSCETCNGLSDRDCVTCDITKSYLGHEGSEGKCLGWEIKTAQSNYTLKMNVNGKVISPNRTD